MYFSIYANIVIYCKYGGENGDGTSEVHFMDAVNDSAKENGNPERPTNPITVAGK